MHETMLLDEKQPQPWVYEKMATDTSKIVAVLAMAERRKPCFRLADPV